MTERREKRASCLISQQENIGTFIAECKKKTLVPIHSSALADSQHRQAPALYILQVDGRQTAGH
jgi:hypothetical protein